jgi:AraC family transcriptional regulator
LDESLHRHGGFLAWLFMRIYNEFLRKDTASSVAIEGLMLELLAAVSRRQVGVSEMRPPRWLRNVREILHSRFQEDLRLLPLSEEAGVHPVHLCREFRRYYQQTVGEYVRKLRIDYACQQMSNPVISLGEIASAAGFADHSHFARTFKRFVGMSPAAFRSNLFGR